MRVPLFPRARQGLLVREVDGEYVAYDPESDRVALLNASAAFVLECCDGRRDRSQIVGVLAAAFEIDRERAARDIDQALLSLCAGGLIESEDAPADER